MKSKVLFLLAIPFVMQIVLVSCRYDSGEISYWALKEIDATIVYDFEFQESASDRDSIVSDYPLIKIDIYAEPVVTAHEFSKFNGIHAAYATSPMPSGPMLKSRIKSITISSDQTYNGNPAGFNLAEYATVTFGDSQEWADSIEEFIGYLNGLYSISEKNTRIIQVNLMPDNELYHRFTIEIESENGSIISTETQQIKWM